MKMRKKWWKKDLYMEHAEKRAKRREVIREIRRFFEEEDFTEVETPALQICPGMEVHLKAFHTTFQEPFDDKPRDFYLHTSPELTMKKLLVAGEKRIFQLAHAFRNEERGQTHSPEFLMLEWYRTGETYEKMMEDTENIIYQCAKRIGTTTVGFNGMSADISAPFERLSVCEAFEKYADLKLTDFLPEKSSLEPDAEPIRKSAERLGIRCFKEDRFEDIFFRIMFEKIEPFLGQNQGTILYDYPTCLGALARRKPTDERFVERFEAYVCGVELCNAFSELTDVKEQEERFLHDQAMKQAIYGDTYPIDTDFLEALKEGMPPCAGNAMGVDRLIMFLTHAEKIDDILWAPLG